MTFLELEYSRIYFSGMEKGLITCNHANYHLC